MTRDEILDAYEDLWREAALENRRQFMAPRGRYAERGVVGPAAVCGWLAAPGGLQFEAASQYVLWRCPEHAFTGRAPAAAVRRRSTTHGSTSCGAQRHSLACVVIHLNNNHRWTWDMFANKFRDALRRGEAARPEGEGEQP